MKRSTLFAAFAFILAGIIACDETPGIVDVTKQQPVLTHLELSPAKVTFVRQDGVKDSLITFELSVLLDNEEPLETPPTATFGPKGSGEMLTSETLSDFNPDTFRYSGQITYPFNTTTFADYTIYVSAVLPGGSISNMTQADVKIRGFATGLPEIEYTEHPDTVYIPSAGQDANEFLITAKAAHPDGLNMIRSVNLELFDKDDNRIGSRKFNMFDDGTHGDQQPNDGVYSKGFEIGPDNQPDEVTIRIYAVDNFDAVSDTVITQMAIVR